MNEAQRKKCFHGSFGTLEDFYPKSKETFKELTCLEEWLWCLGAFFLFFFNQVIVSESFSFHMWSRVALWPSSHNESGAAVSRNDWNDQQCIKFIKSRENIYIKDTEEQSLSSLHVILLHKAKYHLVQKWVI